MLKILILICPIAVDHLHCNLDTAVDSIRSLRVSTPQQCGFVAQTMMASSPLFPEPGKQYMKIMCVRDRTPVQTISLKP